MAEQGCGNDVPALLLGFSPSRIGVRAALRYAAAALARFVRLPFRVVASNVSVETGWPASTTPTNQVRTRI